MYGPPGTGKTFITSVIAKQTGNPIYNINNLTIGSKYVAQTANNLRTIFSEVEMNYKKTGIPSYIDTIDVAIICSGRFDVKLEITLPNKDERKSILTKIMELIEVAKRKNLIGSGR